MTDTNIDRNQHIARRKPLFGALHLLALLLLVVHASESLTAATISITVLPPPRQPENANGEVVLPDRGGRRGSSTLEERIQNSKDEYAASQQ